MIVGSETDNQLNEEQGQDEYRNVRVLQSLDTPTIRLCEKLRGLEPSDDPEVKVGASVCEPGGCGRRS